MNEMKSGGLDNGIELYAIVKDCMLPSISRPSINEIGSRLEYWNKQCTPEIPYQG